MKLGLALGLLAALTLASLFIRSVEAALPTEGVVAFWDHCYSLLYAMNPDGSGRHLLPDVGPGRPLDVSRGAGPVTVLASGQVDPSDPYSGPTLYALRADGSGMPVNLLQPTNPVPGGVAAFSPDGGRIAYLHFESATPPRFELYIGDVVRDAAGNVTGLTNITLVVDLFALGQRTDSTATYPFTGPLDFAPDGLRLVAVIYDDLWVLQLTADGRAFVGASPLTRTKDFAEWNPRWSPTGNAIAFSGGPFSDPTLLGIRGLLTSDMNIYRIDPATLAVRLVTTSRNKGGSGPGKDYPSWSRDGTYLVFEAEGSSASGRRSFPCGSLVNYDLFQIPADGSLKAVNVTNTAGNGVEVQPRWGW